MINPSAFGAGAGATWPPRPDNRTSVRGQPHAAPARDGFAVVPYEPAHLQRLVVDGGQAWLRPLVEDTAYAEGLARQSAAFTGLAGNLPVICAGVTEQWEGRAIAWALLSSAAGQHMLAITRAVARFLDRSGYDRVEAHVRLRPKAGARWCEMLGFHFEGRMRRFLEGDDFDLYARVR